MAPNKDLKAQQPQQVGWIADGWLRRSFNVTNIICSQSIRIWIVPSLHLVSKLSFQQLQSQQQGGGGCDAQVTHAHVVRPQQPQQHQLIPQQPRAQGLPPSPHPQDFATLQHPTQQPQEHLQLQQQAAAVQPPPQSQVLPPSNVTAVPVVPPHVNSAPLATAANMKVRKFLTSFKLFYSNATACQTNWQIRLLYVRYRFSSNSSRFQPCPNSTSSSILRCRRSHNSCRYIREASRYRNSNFHNNIISRNSNLMG